MTKRKIGFAAMALSISSPSLAQDADWRATTLDEIAVSFVDAMSLERSGNQVTFRYQVHFRDKTNVARMTANVSADCAAIRIHDIQATGYRADGTSADIPDRSLKSVTPGSNMAGLIDRACTESWLAEAVVDPAVFAADFFKTL